MDFMGTRVLVIMLWVIVFMHYSLSTAFCARDAKFHSIDHHIGTRKLLASSIPGFISINCGATSDGMDDAGIYYQTDAGFADSGVNAKISSKFITSGLNLELRTLRYFPTGQKNCYTLKPDDGDHDHDQKATTTSYLIRAVFNYGNYDGENHAPKFQLLLGTNNWTTVQPGINGRLDKEIIYTPKNGTSSINVCLVNINEGTPFISALELRKINSSIYQIGGAPLVLDSRYNLGGPNNTVIRYSDDVYDRKWLNLENTEDWIPLRPNFGIDTENNIYEVPVKVLGSAVKSSTGSINFSWVTRYPSMRYYVFFYFAEIEQLQDGKQRTILIHVDDQDMTPFSLKYLQPFTVTNPDQPFMDDTEHYFSISSMDADLPPILNGFEIYHSKIFSVLATNPNDVDAIMKIKQTYMITDNWQGDPCIPVQYAWNGLKCNSDLSSRIISLNLSSRGLPGNIIGSFSNLIALQSLDLSHNDLTGTVPESLGELPFLKLLNLKGNMLEGSVPKNLMEKSKRGALKLTLNGNKKICLVDSCEKKHKEAFVATASVLTLVLLSGVTMFWVWKRKKQGEIYNKSEKEFLWKSSTRPFKFSEVVNITNNFTALIGEGGFGKVYRGILKDGTQVAVKLLSSSSKQGPEEFQAEVKVLMGIHHRNLVSLIGYCKKGDKMALIYEYMANGNLQKHLAADTSKVLTWIERLQIATDAARGLDYLHNGCKPPIVHRDLKTPNILLDENLQAKIADFGLSRAFTVASDHTTDPKGTFGYLDPEYYNNRKLNGKSDVYSFGVVLLELITGCRPVLSEGLEEAMHIGKWVSLKLERNDIESIVDPRIEGNYNISSACKAIEIAIACIPLKANNRLDICDAYHQLKECLDMEKADGRSQTVKSEETVSVSSDQETTDAEENRLEEINILSSSS